MKRGILLFIFACAVIVISLLTSCTVDIHEHTFSNTWTFDNTHHWHEASCGHDVIGGKAEHAWNSGTVTLAPTHTVDGSQVLTCTVCGATKTEVIPALVNSHVFSTDWTTDSTYHWHIATCGHDAVDGKAKHTWGDAKIEKEPTHTEDGSESYTCLICGYTKTVSIPADADAHTFSTDWTHDDANHWHAATCGHDVVSGKVKHSWDEGSVTKEATHTTDGEIVYTCTVCSITKTIVIPAKIDAHTFSTDWTHDDANHWHAATCGHDVVSGKVKHSFDIDGTCEVCGYNCNMFVGYDGLVYVIDTALVSDTVTIPSSMGGITVTSIASKAFECCADMTNINMPDSLKSICGYAFYLCTGLKELTIPSSVHDIGDFAFYGCSSLASVSIPDSLISMGAFVFYGCTSLTDVSIPSSLISLKDSAFRGCTNLTEIIIPNTLQVIGDYTFADCSSLTSIVYNGTKLHWNSYVKKGLYWNKNVPATVVHCSDGDVEI